MSLTKMQRAVEIMRHLVTHDGSGGHGYDQKNRWGSGGTETLTLSNGASVTIPTGDFDSSSAVLTAYKAAGVNINGATYTGNMSQLLCATGAFERKPISFIASPGDLYLNDRDHVAMCLQQKPDQLMEFSCNERGGATGGTVGDQTGRESRIGAFYNYPWNCILHFVGDGVVAPQPPAPPQSAAKTAGSGVEYQVATTQHGWLGAVREASDNLIHGYAGWQGAPINGIKARRLDGKQIRIRTHMAKANKWLEWTTFTNSLNGANASKDGYSGNLTKTDYIDLIQVEGAQIRVAGAGTNYYGWLINGKTPEGDDYAGALGKPIVAIQMKA
jgi:hypothetical protein